MPAWPSRSRTKNSNKLTRRARLPPIGPESRHDLQDQDLSATLSCLVSAQPSHPSMPSSTLAAARGREDRIEPGDHLLFLFHVLNDISCARNTHKINNATLHLSQGRGGCTYSTQNSSVFHAPSIRHYESLARFIACVEPSLLDSLKSRRTFLQPILAPKHHNAGKCHKLRRVPTIINFKLFSPWLLPYAGTTEGVDTGTERRCAVLCYGRSHPRSCSRNAIDLLRDRRDGQKLLPTPL